MNLLPDSLINKIESIAGIDVSVVGQAVVKSGIERMCRRLDVSKNQLYEILAKDSAKLKEYIDLLLVPETWFMRDKGVYNFLSEWVFANNKRSLNILSLPCSSGEEPYSIAMQLMSQGFDKSSFNIDAVDISDACIDKAHKGFYKRYSFKGDSLDKLSKYYEKVDENYYKLKDNVLDSVNFSTGNILNAIFKPKNIPYDVIFCRNLLIYFSREARLKTLNKLHTWLKDDGLLFLGHAENLHGLFNDFISCGPSEAFAFIKKPQFKEPQPTKKKTHILPTKAKSKQLSRNGIDQVMQLADSGRYVKALEFLKSLIDQEPLNVEYLYIEGNIFSAMGQYDQALESFKKCSYINSEHEDSLFQIQQIYTSQGEHEMAKQFRLRLERLHSDE